MTSWTLESVSGGTLVRFSGTYHLPFGLRLLGDSAVEQIVGGQVRNSLVNLQHMFTSGAR